MSVLRTMVGVVAMLLATSASAATINGLVTSVHDGDTVTVSTVEGRVHVRLASIDAPELSQPFGRQAQQALCARVCGQFVTVEENGDVSYGRPIGTIFLNRADVNEEMVAAGDAWVYTRFNVDAAMPGLESRARAERRGLWASPAIPPWQWRRMH